MATDEYMNSVVDIDLFDYFFKELCTLEDQESRPEEERWTKYFDEPDKRVFYKKEGDSELMTVMTDCVIEANFGEALACYENREILDEIMPDFNNI